ncbi:MULTISPECIES: phosphopantetheine-binding protein [Kitasatospora]|uniref:Carrier domain-containing protein n=1 Tax=Kitasatospora setae (strain ATCC 33774 / DSM 43861 / JCM 3304 / KCC A-0304 / NBRC 14216 / KM-6054) TaxID=452652 RepID=E4NBI7_KITSK|nr:MULTISPECIES: phosphopantetheine-binding protein [Kitasatospora]BAJ28568.1 hypothetical protein KSE_27570 [Kitasatospora setae KM-6054]
MSTVLEQPLLRGVAAEVAALLAERGERDGGFEPSSRFHDDLGFDSVMLMQLKYRIETRFPELGELSLADMVDGLTDVATLAGHLAELAEEDR